MIVRTVTVLILKTRVRAFDSTANRASLKKRRLTGWLASIVIHAAILGALSMELRERVAVAVQPAIEVTVVRERTVDPEPQKTMSRSIANEPTAQVTKPIPSPLPVQTSSADKSAGLAGSGRGLFVVPFDQLDHEGHLVRSAVDCVHRPVATMTPAERQVCAKFGKAASNAGDSTDKPAIPSGVRATLQGIVKCEDAMQKGKDEIGWADFRDGADVCFKDHKPPYATADLGVDPSKRLAFDAAAKRDLVGQPFLALKPKNGCVPRVASTNDLPGRASQNTTAGAACALSF